MLEPKITAEDLVFFRKYFGDKTINQIREEMGVAPLDESGDIVYADWLSNFIVRGANLKIVQ